MKSTYLFLLAFIALGQNSGRARANSECSTDEVEERTLYCVRIALVSLLGNTQEEICKELKKSANCMETVADECIEDEYRGFVDKELKKMNDMIDNMCSHHALDKLENAECRLRRVEERLRKCFSGTLRLIGMNNAPEEKICSELKNTQDCIKNVADECLNEIQRSLVEEQFKKMNDKMKLLCTYTDLPAIIEEVDDTDDADQCIDTHKDFIYGCLQENQMRAMSHFFGASHPNKSVMTCTLYNWISECVVERVENKCGVVASKKMRDDLNEPPSDIKAACHWANMKYQH